MAQDTMTRAEQLVNLLGGAMPQPTHAEKLAWAEDALRREHDRRAIDPAWLASLDAFKAFVAEGGAR